jgi:hypothetical protein
VQGRAHRGGPDAGQQHRVEVGVDLGAGALGEGGREDPLGLAERRGQPADQRRVRLDDREAQRPEVGLRGHLDRLGVGHRAQRLDRGLRRRARADRLGLALGQARVEAEDGVVLGGEVVEERARGDVGPRGDVVHRHPVQPALGHEPQRRLVEREPGSQLLALPQPVRHEQRSSAFLAECASMQTLHGVARPVR